MSSPADAKIERPLSPHLQIYKPQLTSALSILHRITGVGLAFGLVIFVAWLVALASGPENYQSFLTCAQSPVGQVILFCLSLAFFYHLANGIRHLFWDLGLGLDIKDAYKTGRLVVLTAVILTALVWLNVYGVIL